MLNFKKYISEEVLPTAMVQDGNFDVRNEAVRANINNILGEITSCSHVTPYVTLRKISKALAYFSIILPKRSFLEGKGGVEVYELMQFGNKIGMTDQGEFINEVPEKCYLFFQYNVVMGRCMCMAKVVEKAELDKLLDMAEMTIKENCGCDDKATMSQRSAEGEEIRPETSSTKKATEISMRRKDKKLSADRLDEVSKGAAISAYRGKEAEDRSTTKLRGLIRKKWGEKTVKHAERAGAQDTGNLVRKGESHGTDYLSRSKPSSEMRKTKSGKVHKQDVESKKSEIKFRKTMSKFDKPRGHLPEETLDETRMPASVIRHKQKLANMTPEEKAKKFAGKSEEHLKSMARRHGYGKDSDVYSKHIKEDNLDEKLTKGMSAADVIHDFVHSDDPKFKGKSTKERQKMALGAYYGMHPEKSRKE